MCLVDHTARRLGVTPRSIFLTAAIKSGNPDQFKIDFQDWLALKSKDPPRPKGDIQRFVPEYVKSYCLATLSTLQQEEDAAVQTTARR